ncbi:uncharacterized protein LOC129727139 isoform X3 [Wyeomyia smithii]|uniref:uncharacterized protein LOC129727139 isoform X3 n=1 Tax=Wyeomyia smithii TaxID=174621 RepID=UPI002467E906|nr:uncharacterized protein LOC129727139 isoform X3 [Wyeomyia smithii]
MLRRAVNVYDSFRPLEVLLKCCGMFLPFRETSPIRSTSLRCRVFNWLFLLVIYVIWFVILKCMWLVPFGDQPIPLVMVKSTYIIHTIVYFQPLVSFTLCLTMEKHLRGMIDDLHGVDNTLNKISILPIINHNTQRRLILTFLSSYEIFTVGMMVASQLTYNGPSAKNAISGMYSTLYLILTSGHFTATLWLILIRFGGINSVFRMYFPTNPTCSGFPSVHTETTVCSEKEQLTVIKQIKILHDKLNDVVELVNYCFSVQITFCVGLCFVIGVVCSFGLFRAFIYRNELFYMGVLNFIWYMYYLFFVLFFIAVGSKITREGKRIGVLVHKAINCSTSSAVINELNIFSQQLLHRSPVITCGLFVYDWTLLYTMIGATATYLIILIQFDVSFPNLVNVNNGTTSTGSAGT